MDNKVVDNKNENQILQENLLQDLIIIKKNTSNNTLDDDYILKLLIKNNRDIISTILDIDQIQNNNKNEEIKSVHDEIRIILDAKEKIYHQRSAAY